MKAVPTPVGILLAAAGFAAVPLMGLPAFYDSLLYLALHWVVLATSWNILSGYAGYFSFGHGVFFGAGVYTTATLTSKFDWPFLWTLPAAAAVAALTGIALGAVVFRAKGIRGELFALLTLAVNFVMATVILNTPIDGGPGVYLNSVPVPALGPAPSSTFYLLALATAALTVLVSWRIHSSRFGTGLFAIHDDEDAAEVLGVPTFRWKLAALAISCALAGVAGGIHALFVSYVTVSEVFSITVPVTVILMSVLGGTRHWGGPALGAFIITGLLYAFTSGDHALLGKAVTGAVLVAAILFMPQGVLEQIRRRRQRTDSTLPASTDAAAPEPVRTDAPPQPSIAPEAACAPARESRGDVLLRVRGLSKSFRGLKALNGIDVDVRRGEILGLLGPNGSGKSTFINTVSGHHLPNSGQVLLEGRDLAGRSAHRIAQAGIARTYQIPRPFRHLSVLDNVALSAMYGRFAAPSLARGREEAMKWLEFTGLQAKASACPDALNLHQRKFLELARALAARPQLVLLDEVLCGLTPSEIQQAVAMIRRIRDQGCTILFVEHVMDAVMALTDRIVVFNEGTLLAEGAATQVMRRPDVMTAYLGVAHA